MFFLTSLIKSFILVLLSYSQFVSSAALVSQSIPKGLYHECNGGGFLELCSNTISEAWQYGRLTSFTQEHQFFTGSTTPCKITYWTDSDQAVAIWDISLIREAINQIDQFCSLREHQSSAAVSPAPTSSAGHGVFVGSLGQNGEHVAIIVESFRT